jgi:hypothetical protein
MTTDTPPAAQPWTWADAADHLDEVGPEHKIVPTPELGEGRTVTVRALSRAESLKVNRLSTSQPDQSRADAETLIAGIVSPRFTFADYQTLKQHPSAAKVIARLSREIAALTTGTDPDAEDGGDAVAAAGARFREP